MTGFQDGDIVYMLDGKRVDRNAFVKAAGKSGLLDMDGSGWDTFYEKNGTMRQCLAGEYLFTTIRFGKPCLN